MANRESPDSGQGSAYQVRRSGESRGQGVCKRLIPAFAGMTKLDLLSVCLTIMVDDHPPMMKLVTPDLIRGPLVSAWIPAFAGMTTSVVSR
jgi:hypothetical protein